MEIDFWRFVGSELLEPSSDPVGHSIQTLPYDIEHVSLMYLSPLPGKPALDAKGPIKRYEALGSSPSSIENREAFSRENLINQGFRWA
jgi:hypothetical protein